MPLSDTVAVILAAGKGTRLKSAIAKVLHQAGGSSLVDHVIRACQSAAPRTIIVVAGYQASQVASLAQSLGARVVVQEPQNGTGHALLTARRAIPRNITRALVVPGDAPLIRAETLSDLLDVHRKSGAAAAVLTANLPDPSGYGRIIRKPHGSGSENEIAAIVEQKSATPEERLISEVNSGIYSFSLDVLWPLLKKIRPDNAHREIYLTDVVALLCAAGQCVVALPVRDAREILGCNTRAELSAVDHLFRQRKASALMDAGVTLYLPETILIDADVRAGQDTVVHPAAQLLGRTRIGARCTIGAGCVLLNAEIADDVEIKPYSLIFNSRLAHGAGVGPFAHIRDGAELAPLARIGNFVEVKKSKIGRGVKAMHLSYLGDAAIGAHTNIGAGTITCNYDGVRKNPTTIGDSVFIGSGTELIAPVRVGSRAYVAAGSTITCDVPANALAIARARQSNKPGWAKSRPKITPEPVQPSTKTKPARKTGKKNRPAPGRARSRRAK